MKIRDLVGRALVALTGKSDTSVPHKIWPDGQSKGGEGGPANGGHRTPLPGLSFPDRAAGPVKDAVFDDAALIEQLRAVGMIPDGVTPRVTIMRVGDSFQEVERPGIKPPDESEMTWEFWSNFMRREALIDGWAPCRYANRGPDHKVRFVFGLTRGYFGMYQSPYVCCLHDEDAHGQEERILTALTHLPTGFALGLFATQADAAFAADLIGSLNIDWKNLDTNEPYGPNGFVAAMRPIQTSWEFGGMAPADFHAHADDHNGMMLVVWEKNEAALTAGAPKNFGKLS